MILSKVSKQDKVRFYPKFPKLHFLRSFVCIGMIGEVEKHGLDEVVRMGRWVGDIGWCGRGVGFAVGYTVV